MDHVITPDPSGTGSWVLILGCPQPKLHELMAPEHGLSGPSFATCASCDHQTGAEFSLHSLDGWVADIFPERLTCGFPDGSPELA